MTQARMIEGTTEEIARRLQQEYAGQKLRVFVEQEIEEDLAADIPDPPETIRNHAHLIELLHEGMRGELQPVADHEWAELRAEARTRLAQRKK